MNAVATQETIAAQVAAYLANIGIKFTVEGGTQTVRDDWKCFAWRATLGGESFDYYTGLGLVKKVPAYRRDYAAAPIPLKPTAADILHSLVSDSSAAEQSFSDWCDDLGYDSDSLKAFDTYRACCACGQQLRKVFTTQQLVDLRELVQDL